jgi:tetratricopeptide (TPR) repeat protein
VAARAESKVPNYQKLPLEKIRYPLGNRLLALGSEDQALDQFKVAADDPGTPERERALSNLRAGEILDTMGRRDEAVSYYHRVQQLEAFDGSHEIAEQYLQSPYQPE